MELNYQQSCCQRRGEKKYAVIWTLELKVSLASDVEIMQSAMFEKDKLGLKKKG